jgi:hypothetical protein
MIATTTPSTIPMTRCPVLRDRDAVRRGVGDLTDLLERVAGLLHRVVDDRAVRQVRVDAVGRQRGVDVGLLRETL